MYSFDEILNEKLSLKERIKRWFSYTLTYRIEIPYNTMKIGIYNLFKWRKIIYNDNDFGYNSVMIILKFKLENLSKKLKSELRVSLIYKIRNFINNVMRAYKILRNNLSLKNYLRLIEYINRPIVLHYNKIDTKYIDICIKLIEKLYGCDINIQNYEDEYTNYYKNEMLFSEKDNKGCRQVNFKEIWNKYDEYFLLNKNLHKKAIDLLNKEQRELAPYSIAITISKLKHDKARKLLFKILDEKIEDFCD